MAPKVRALERAIADQVALGELRRGAGCHGRRHQRDRDGSEPDLQRSSLRTTSLSPDHTSSTAQTLMSTKPSGSATSRTTSSVISVGTLADFFGHDTHTAAFGSSF